MKKICGNADISCCDFFNGECYRNECFYQVLLPNDKSEKVEFAKFKYMAQILDNQQSIIKRLDDLKVK